MLVGRKFIIALLLYLDFIFSQLQSDNTAYYIHWCIYLTWWWNQRTEQSHMWIDRQTTFHSFIRSFMIMKVVAHRRIYMKLMSEWDQALFYREILIKIFSGFSIIKKENFTNIKCKMKIIKRQKSHCWCSGFWEKDGGRWWLWWWWWMKPNAKLNEIHLNKWKI